MTKGDFYTYYKICIEYNKDNKKELVIQDLLETKKYGEWVECLRDWDNNESLNDFYERQEEERHQQINEQLLKFPRTQLYKDGTWIQGGLNKDKYMAILKSKNISLYSLIAIWKEGDYIITNPD